MELMILEKRKLLVSFSLGSVFGIVRKWSTLYENYIRMFWFLLFRSTEKVSWSIYIIIATYICF